MFDKEDFKKQLTTLFNRCLVEGICRNTSDFFLANVVGQKENLNVSC